MRIRFVLIALALAILVFGGLRLDDRGSADSPRRGNAASRLEAPAAPDAEPPAIVRAALTASATAQTHVACEWQRCVNPAQDVSAASREALAEPGYGAATPRSFPLLI